MMQGCGIGGLRLHKPGFWFRENGSAVEPVG